MRGKPIRNSRPSTLDSRLERDSDLLVRHPMTRRPKVLMRRVRQKVRNPAGIDAGVVFDLLAEPAGFGPLFEYRSPEGVVSCVHLLAQVIAPGDHGPQV